MAITRALIQSDWSQLDLRPESIPHLLHWDLGYLWILEKPVGLRPVTWRKRVETWKRLMCLLLVGELEAVPCRIDPPMLEFTREYGIDRLHELRYRGQAVGVTSPVVLLRPLPDSEHQPLPELPDLHLERGEEVQHFIGLLIGLLSRLLEETASGSARSPSCRKVTATSPLKVNLNGLLSRFRTIFSHIPRSTSTGSERGGQSTVRRRSARSMADRKTPANSVVKAPRSVGS